MKQVTVLAHRTEIIVRPKQELEKRSQKEGGEGEEIWLWALRRRRRGVQARRG